MAETTDFERQLQALGAELHKLEAEYTMYFAGRSVRPPNETRARVEALLRRLDRAGFDNATQRFRFGNLQSRFTALSELWDRGMRAKEEGRPGPFVRSRAAHDAPPAHGPASRLVGVVAFSEAHVDADRLEELYEAVASARREAGEPPVPFHRFAHLVRTQVERLCREGQAEVAFEVAVKDGRVNLTVKVFRGGDR